jgi:ABC-type lipoprotein release transport system permease subunit
MFFFTYLRRELRHRMRQAVVTALGLALGIGLVITVTALSSGVRTAQGKVLGALFGVGTDITVTTATAPASGSAGLAQITPEPYVQHSDTLSSPSQGTMSGSAVAAIARLHDVSAAAGALVLTEIKSTIPADNAPPPPSFQPPVQVSVTGVDLRHGGLGPMAVARLVSGRGFTAGQADAAGIGLGLGGAAVAAAAAPKLTATVQTSNTGPGGFGGSLGAGGGIFHGTVGGPVQTFANPNATHTVAVPFTAPVTIGAIVVAAILAIAAALLAGSLGGWRISRLRPAEALARVA